MTPDYIPGALVSVRDRDWIVIKHESPLLTLRPITSGEETVIHTQMERPEPARFDRPDAGKDIGNYARARLLSDAVRLKLKDGAGPFRSMGRLSFEPRDYQYVPLLMALQLPTTRLLIADDVGIGKTIEAGMILAELLARREIKRFAVLCPPHLCDQWKQELHEKFNITAQTVTASLAPRLERDMPPDARLFEHHPYTVVSLDFIKTDRRRHEFIHACPELVIIDEAHTRIWRGGTHQGYKLLKGLAEDSERHMIYLTATPHSGDDSAFFRLLGLLDSEFEQLEEASDNKRRRLRERLGKHLVQRMRQDITNVGYQENPFPERVNAEIPYTLEGTAGGELLHSLLDYCRRTAQEKDDAITYWTMLGLMRSVSSSPRAAQQTLENRLAKRIAAVAAAHSEDLDIEEIKRHIMDGDEEDTGGYDELPPMAALSDADTELANLAKKAKKLADRADDPKFAALLNELQQMLKDGRNPIVFCRYIATAKYVAEALPDRLGNQKDLSIRAITGELPPVERGEMVESLGNANQRILVATDCLSEGINLQQHFDCVIHYDLSWNPTRHQQREGRVDRLQQRSPQVHTRMIYGRDNPMDGAVLQVILRKADKIRQELGIYVPLPDDTESMFEALLKAVLLRGDKGAQMTLFPEMQEAKYLAASWEKATAAQKRRRTIFAQQRIKPAELIPITKEIVEKLGDANAARRFIHAALSWRGVAVAEVDDDAGGLTARFDGKEHPDLAQWLPNGESKIRFKSPVPPRALYLHRAHPMVRHLAERVFESALLPEPEVHRAGASYSAAVEQVTTIVIVRMRHQLHTARKDIQVAEETAVISIKGVNAPVINEDEGVLRLLDEAPAMNMPPQRKAIEVENALKRLEQLQERLNAIAKSRAKELREAHEKVREGLSRKGNLAAIQRSDTALPPDIIGVYVVVPASGAGRGAT